MEGCEIDFAYLSGLFFQVTSPRLIRFSHRGYIVYENINTEVIQSIYWIFVFSLTLLKIQYITSPGI